MNNRDSIVNGGSPGSNGTPDPWRLPADPAGGGVVVLHIPAHGIGIFPTIASSLPELRKRKIRWEHGSLPDRSG